MKKLYPILLLLLVIACNVATTVPLSTAQPTQSPKQPALYEYSIISDCGPGVLCVGADDKIRASYIEVADPTPTTTETIVATSTLTTIETVVPTLMATDTETPTLTYTPTATATHTETPTYTPTHTPTPTDTPTSTATPTNTVTPSNTPTPTITPSPTRGFSLSQGDQVDGVFFVAPTNCDRHNGMAVWIRVLPRETEESVTIYLLNVSKAQGWSRYTDKFEGPLETTVPSVDVNGLTTHVTVPAGTSEFMLWFTTNNCEQMGVLGPVVKRLTI